MEQLKSFGRELTMGTHMGSSKEFLDLVKAIGEAKSKAEEDRITSSEIETLKKKIGEPDVSKKRMREYIIRLVYIEMLGHDASFGYIHAVKMTHDDNLLLKKTGYLAVTLFLDENHDLIILIVNTIQKDLKSDNHLVVCAALGAVCKLINEETVPAVLPQVIELMNHPKEMVRKKAVMALHRFLQRSVASVSHVIPRFRQVLCDKDPSVMSAALCVLHELIASDAAPYKNLTGSFVSILKQVAESRLPSVYNYHKTPAPFIQIKLLKILALLGLGDKGVSEHMYAILADVLKRADSGITIGNAILYECICTVTSIYPNTKLLVTCAEITSRLLKSESHNLKYVGIDALGRVVKINPDFANEHQLAVIDCLEDPDDTLKRKTLDLLYKMTKPANVEVIVERMIQYMRGVQDVHTKTEITAQIVELAERFAPTNIWYLQTMNAVFELSGDLVQPKVAHDLMRLIAEGSGEDDEESDSLLRTSAVESYLKLLEEPKLPSVLLQVICWVLGEYGTADGAHSAVDIIARLCDIAEGHSSDNVVRGYVISAITKVVAFEIGAGRRPKLMPEVRSLIEELSASHSTDLQQRAYELQSMLGLTPSVVAAVMPLDASCEDIEADKKLAFLDQFVSEALRRGAQPYIPEGQRLGSGSVPFSGADSAPMPQERSLRFEAYGPPPTSSSMALVPSAPHPHDGNGVTNHAVALQPSSSSLAGPYGSNRPLPAVEAAKSGPESTRLKLDGVQKKWGRPLYTPATATSAGSSGGPSGSSSDARHNGPDTDGLPGEVERSAVPSEPPSSSRYLERKKQQQAEISAEKQALAASLFGGRAAAAAAPGDAKRAAGAKAGPHRAAATKSQPNSRPSSTGKSAPSSSLQVAISAAAPAPVAAQPAPDLLDFSDSASTALSAPAAAVVTDPFQQLEGLLDVVGPNATPAPAPAPAAMGPGSDLLGTAAAGDVSVLPVHDHAGAPPSGSSGDLQAVEGLPTLGVDSQRLSHSLSGTSASSPGSGAKKGIDSSVALQKDAVSRQVGVVTSTGGANPELFKDIWS